MVYYFEIALLMSTQAYKESPVISQIFDITPPIYRQFLCSVLEAEISWTPCNEKGPSKISETNKTKQTKHRMVKFCHWIGSGDIFDSYNAHRTNVVDMMFCSALLVMSLFRALITSMRFHLFVVFTIQ